MTDGASVAAAFEKTIEAFGGIDIVVINAGLAHVSPLAGMNLDAFRKLERVNVEGTLLLLSQAGKLFALQNTGGDVVLVSTKNVFAPGAKFGAYSATKAAAHQLCRIASIEFAEMGVRVNMVAPDAVFSHGATKSGLWAQVGPDRMKARGLDEKGLGRVLPPAKSVEGAGHREACRTGRRFFRDPPDTDDRRDDSRRRRVAGRVAPVE